MYVCSSGFALEERWASHCVVGSKGDFLPPRRKNHHCHCNNWEGSCSVVLEYNDVKGINGGKLFLFFVYIYICKYFLLYHT